MMSTLMVFSVVSSIIKNMKNIVNIIFALEMGSLVSFFFYSMSSVPSSSLWLGLVILVFGACESALALTLLVTNMKSKGSDLTTTKGI